MLPRTLEGKSESSAGMETLPCESYLPGRSQKTCFLSSFAAGAQTRCLLAANEEGEQERPVRKGAERGRTGRAASAFAEDDGRSPGPAGRRGASCLRPRARPGAAAVKSGSLKQIRKTCGTSRLLQVRESVVLLIALSVAWFRALLVEAEA